MQTIKYIKCPKQHKYLKIIIYKKFSKQLLPSKHSSWWRSIEDVSRLRFQKTSSRRIYFLVVRLQDIFKKFSRHLQDVLQKRLEGIFKTPWRRFEDVFKTSSRLIAKMSAWDLQDIFKAYRQAKLFLLTGLPDVYTHM